SSPTRISSPTLGCSMVRCLPRSARKRRLHPAVEEPGDDESRPDDEAEEAEQVHRRALADAFLPELAEIRHHAEGEKREDEEDATEAVRLVHRGFHPGEVLRPGDESKQQDEREGDDVADDELGEALPDLADARPIARALVDARRPDVGEDESPDADED